jgi:16S rRNA (guanine1516-N2)-methyltransferase
VKFAKFLLMLIGLKKKEHLFEAAFATTRKRVVVKSPDYAPPLGGKPSESFAGKLLSYDVYLKS